MCCDGMMSDIPIHEIRVDRSAAVVRAVWRLCAAVIAGGSARLIGAALRWGILWQNERASFAAFALIVTILGIAAATFGWIALRWLALALWPGHLGIRLSSRSVCMRLGPFGSHDYRWADIEIQAGQPDLPDDDEPIVDDSILIRLQCRNGSNDVALAIRRFGHLDNERLNELLRPYVERANEGGPPARRPDPTSPDGTTE